MVFQPVGFTKLPRSHEALVGSYPTFSPLPAFRRAVSLSAALSVARPFPAAPLPVRKHGALRCPDFPLRGLAARSDGAMHRISMNAFRSPMSVDQYFRCPHAVLAHVRIVELQPLVILEGFAHFLT